MARQITVVFLFLIFVFNRALSTEVKDRQEQLETIKAELDAKRADYDKLGNKEKDELGKLRDIEQEMTLSGQLLLKLNREIDRVSGNIETQKIELFSAEKSRIEKKNILNTRLRYIYKNGEEQDWLQVLTSQDASSALVAYKNFIALIQYDKRLMQNYNNLTKTIKFGLSQLKQNAALLEKMRLESENELEIRNRSMQSRKRLLNKLRKDKNEMQKSISRLEDDAKEIAGIIENLQNASQQDINISGLPGLAESKGKLIWPVEGGILKDFGSFKDKRGIELSNPGIDIKADYGANVKAAAAGIVIYVSWLRGYGQFIILDHGDGYYTLYANLSEALLEVGDKINAGDIIAEAGDSGSLEGSKLHFEVRHKKEQLNPREWLR